jgi:adenine-specific DNA-methyltransferase
MNKTDLIQKVKALDGLSQDERAYLINLVNTKKKYGLVWEDKPEEVEEQLRENLPVLKEVKDKAIVNGEDYPNHILIEGDNLHALTALSFTHEGKVDVIYIDPPYNTGKEYEFKYNDKWVDKIDSFKHSKWLAFLNKRLVIAKRLLSKTGVIFISIDDYEHAQLRMLCDEIFKEKNLLSVLIWDKQHSQQQGIFKKYHEYIYVYANDSELIKNITGGSGKIIAGAMKKVSIKNPASEFTFPKGIRFDAPDGTKLNGTYGDSEKVTVVKGVLEAENGKTKHEVTLSAGWTQKKQMENLFKGKETFDTKGQKVLEFYFNSTGKLKCEKERVAVTPSSMLPKYGMVSEQTQYLKEILFGEERFSNPKPVEMIKDFIKWFSPSGKKSTILDFFAGSGTTLDAVLQLNNEEDEKGKRECIIITNNELTEPERKKHIENGVNELELYNFGLCNYVTYPRVSRILTGYQKPNGEEIGGINNNLRFYKSEFLSRDTSLKNRRELTQLATELLCIKEDCYTEQKIKIKQVKLFANTSVTLLILFDDNIIPEVVESIKGMDAKEIKVYVFSMGSDPYTEDFAEVLGKVTLCALPDAIYKAYQNVLPKKKRTVPLMDEVTEIPTNENGEQLSIL